MRSLLYFLRRAGEQPFRETLNQARSLTSERIRGVLQPAYDRVFTRELSNTEILRRSSCASGAALLGQLRSREWPELDLSMPKAVEAAERILARQFDVLGSGPMDCATLPWHVDIKSGYVWDASLHYRKVPLSPGPGVDIKVPWEISRCHHLVTLGIAYRETGDARFSRDVVTQIQDWIANNPPRHGVNWINPMEAGIRAVNWFCAFNLIRSSDAVDDKFAFAFLRSMHTHASFIRANLEIRNAWVNGVQRRLNSNHYLCDLLGLLWIGWMFPELDLRENADFAEQELAQELKDQTSADGVDYEHSTAYHAFVLEIFRLAAVVGVKLDQDRMARMEGFAAAARHPDGSRIQIGDNDSGRVLPQYSIAVAPAQQSMAFPDAGFYSMRGRTAHVFVSAARVGMYGYGSHSHNDVLSFEYFANGRPWIVDPGTFVYLPNIDARNWFRSTAAHNTVRVDREEIRSFHPESVFQMVDGADIRVHKWMSNESTDVMEGEHTGYGRLSKTVTHKRAFEFTKQDARLIIRDILKGTGEHQCEWFFQIHPDVDVQRAGSDIILSKNSSQVRLHVECRNVEVLAVPGWYSPAYGVRQPATTIVARTTATLPVTANITIEPC